MVRRVAYRCTAMRTGEFNSMLVARSDEHCDSCLYALKYRLLDLVVKLIRKY